MNRYFDHNATTPMSEAAKRAWLEAAERHWHNPSSLYREAGLARHKLEEARERLAGLLGCEAERIVFTSGATESNNALFSSLALSLPRESAVAISSIEHPSVREAVKCVFAGRWMEIPVNAQGVVDPDSLSELFQNKKPAVVSVMAASNESGAIQPWEKIQALCRNQGVLFHTDASQWTGKIAADHLGSCDYLTGSAHKFGGPKGCGFLVLREENEGLHHLRGGPQENSRRAGTENYPAVEGMLAALEEITPHLDDIAQRQRTSRDSFIGLMLGFFPDARLISGETARLWNTVLMVMPRHENLKWLVRLSRKGFCISTGSACSSGKEGSAAVVQALGATPDELRRVVRISGGPGHNLEDWQQLAEAFVEVGRELDQARGTK